MNRHPGGEEQTLHLLKSIELKKGMKALDLGAGEGETVRIMKAFGLNVQGRFSGPSVYSRQYGSLYQPVCIFCQQRSEKGSL